MKSILIGGYYGANNAGDEAILHAILTDLRSYDANLNFIVVCKNPEKIKNEHGVEAIEWENIDALLDAALRTDLIILGGGGIFHDYWGIDPDQYLRKGYWDITAFGSLPLLAELLDIPCVILGVGVGPFKTDLGREHTRRAFERCQAATVRDNESMGFLRQAGLDDEHLTPPFVRVIPDLVFRFELRLADQYDADELLEEKFSIGKEIPLLGISLRYWEAETPLKERLSSIARGVRQFLKMHPLVHAMMIPFQVLEATPHTDDTIVLRELSKIIDIPDRVHVIETALKPHLVQALIHRCTAILGKRFHSIVMGINTGTPAVALSYAPKVQAAMKLAGLEEYCNITLAPDANHLEKQLNDVWRKSSELRVTLLSVGKSLKTAAYGHTRVVVDLIDHLETRPPLGFAQEFAVKQTRLLFQAEEQNTQLQQELYIYRQNLNEIESSRLWKFVKTYYRLVELPIIKNVRRFLLSWNEGGMRTPAHPSQSVNLSRNNFKNHVVETEEEFNHMIAEFGRLPLNGIFIITSPLVDNKMYAQGSIHFSKSLARQGWGIVYLIDQDNQDAVVHSLTGKEYRNIFVMPVDMFIDQAGSFHRLSYSSKYFVIESPHPNLFLPALQLRNQGFDIVYEITADWESVHQSNQIIWFDRNFEAAYIVNANVVTATSQDLLDRFSHLRQEISLVPNGYNSQFSGKKHLEADWEQRSIALLETLKRGKWISL